MNVRRRHEPLRGGRRLARVLLAIGFWLPWAPASQADTVTVVRDRSADFDCGPVPKVCILPFFDSAALHGFDPDLGALLETSLRQEPGLRIVPAWTERRSVYRVEPWLLRSVWSGPEVEPEAHLYFRLRRVWVEQAASLGSSDFLVAGRIVRTGSLATLLADVLPASGGSGEVVASLAKEARQAEGIPAAIRELAAAVARAVGRDRTRRCLNQAWVQYRSGAWSIDRAIQEGQTRVDEQPDCLECRLLLLGLFQEGGEPYAEQAEHAARSLVTAWRDWTEETRRAAAENDIDPFLLLCEREAARADWAAVETTAQLGSQVFPLNSREYDKWRARSLLERGLWEDARQELEELARHAPYDPEIKGWLDQTAEGMRSQRVQGEKLGEKAPALIGP